MSCSQLGKCALLDTVRFLQHHFGFINIMALHEVEPELEQYGHRIGVLDAFGNRLDISFFGCVNYFLHTLSVDK